MDFSKKGWRKGDIHRLTVQFNPLGAMCIYICTRAPTAHRDEHIYMHTI